MPDLVDVYAPAAPGSLTRSHSVHGVGRFRLARRDAELYSVQIISAGAGLDGQPNANSGAGLTTGWCFAPAVESFASVVKRVDAAWNGMWLVEFPRLVSGG